MRYRVSFFKNLLCLDGSASRCLQQSIVIRRAKSIDRAVEAAKRRYERLCEVADWRLHADGVELEIDLNTIKSGRCSRRCTGSSPDMIATSRSLGAAWYVHRWRAGGACRLR